MKAIISNVPLEFLESVSTGLQKNHIHGMSVSTVHGFGQEHDELHPDHRAF